PVVKTQMHVSNVRRILRKNLSVYSEDHRPARACARRDGDVSRAGRGSCRDREVHEQSTGPGHRDGTNGDITWTVDHHRSAAGYEIGSYQSDRHGRIARAACTGD